MKMTSTSDCSESWAAAAERCSTYICFLYSEGFKLNVLNNGAIAQAFELSSSLIDPRAEKTADIFFIPFHKSFIFTDVLTQRTCKQALYFYSDKLSSAEEDRVRLLELNNVCSAITKLA